jgi:hypothetical protein
MPRNHSRIRSGRALRKRPHRGRIPARWRASGATEHGIVAYANLPAAEVEQMSKFFFSLHPANDEQQERLHAAKDVFATIIHTQVLMVRVLKNPVPTVLLGVVAAWSCLLFFGYARSRRATR